VGGRTTYKNAADTRRRGVEAAWQGDLGNGFSATASYTWLSAIFSTATTTGVPPQVIRCRCALAGRANGHRIRRDHLGRRRRSPTSLPVSKSQYAGKMYVKIATPTTRIRTRLPMPASASSSGVGAWVLREFTRLNNLTDRNYAATVIVCDTNNRFFTAPQRNYMIGGQRQCRFLTASRATRGPRLSLHWTIALLAILSIHMGW